MIQILLFLVLLAPTLVASNLFRGEYQVTSRRTSPAEQEEISNYDDYDFVIIGAESTSVAFAYHASRLADPESRILLLERQDMGSNRYWSSGPGARHISLHYKKKYMLEYAKMANAEWADFNNGSFVSYDGMLWFGDSDMPNSQGDTIFEVNSVLKKEKISRLYMDSLIDERPSFLSNFVVSPPIVQGEREGRENKKNQKGGGGGDKGPKEKQWSGLYTKFGGSVNMKDSYQFFLNAAQQSGKLTVVDKCQVLQYRNTNGEHFFRYQTSQGEQIYARGKKIFISNGVNTGKFVTDILRLGSTLEEQTIANEYVVSYFPIEGNVDNFRAENMPSWSHFLPGKNGEGVVYSGSPYHEWDTQSEDEQTVKITSPSFELIADVGQISEIQVGSEDNRVRDLREYVGKYMKNVKDVPVRSYKVPIAIIDGRQTVLDFVNRLQKDIVVCTGGWIENMYPTLAKTALKMLKEPGQLTPEEKKFLSRTKYPIRKTVKNILRDERIPSDGERFNTIIVGAGAAGLYSAFRMMNSLEQQMSDKKVGVFEALDRIGGRLMSARFRNVYNYMQFGGSRFIEGNHGLFSHYASLLDMSIVESEVGTNKMKNGQSYAYFRGTKYPKNAWSDYQKNNRKLQTDFKVDSRVIGMTTFQIISYSLWLIITDPINENAVEVLNRFRKEKDGVDDYFQKHVRREVNPNWPEWADYIIQLDLEDWNEIKNQLLYNFSGEVQPINRFGFQNVIENQFSHETYLFINQHNGYYSSSFNGNYIQLVIQFVIDFGDVVYKTLYGGHDIIAYNFALNLLLGQNNLRNNYKVTDTEEDQNPGGIFLKNFLVSIEKSEDDDLPTYKLLFKNTKDGEQQYITVYADSVLLGLPRKPLQGLYHRSQLLKEPLTNYNSQLQGSRPIANFLQLLGSRRNIHSIKIYMNFFNNWWDTSKQFCRSTDEMKGNSVTDLPIRQVRYFGEGRYNFILASYNDMVTTQFWSSLQDNCQKKFVPQFTYIPNSSYEQRKQADSEIPSLAKQQKFSQFDYEDIPKESGMDASILVVKELLSQLSEIHGVTLKLEDVKQVFYQNWGEEPFGGGYHGWEPGYDARACMRAIRRPWTDQRIFVAGEAYSNFLGWVQGAFQTAQHVLKDGFNIQATDQKIYFGD